MAGPYTPNPNDPTRPYNNDEVQYGAEEIRKMKAGALAPLTWKGVTGTPYTVLSSDLTNGIFMVNGGQIIVPLGLGPGIFAFTGLEGTEVVGAMGVTIHKPPSLLPQLYEDYGYGILTRISTNVWLISGNLDLVPSP